ncbi:MAG: hypothetical protein U0670_07420 [Anaerolineae bacterium]
MLKLALVFATLFSSIGALLIGGVSRSWGTVSTLPPEPLVMLVVDRSYRRIGMILPSPAQRETVPLLYQGRTLTDLVCSADGNLLRISDGNAVHWFNAEGETDPPSESANALPMGMTDRMARSLGDNLRQQAVIVSPDGAWIVFTRNAALTEINPELWLAASDGSAPNRRIGSGVQPAWSPDSRLLVYAQAFQEGDAQNYELMLMDVMRGESFRLTRSPFFDLYPAWSLDGTQIVFSTQRSGTPQVSVMNANGRDPRLLTATPNVFRLCFLRALPTSLIAPAN